MLTTLFYFDIIEKERMATHVFQRVIEQLVSLLVWGASGRGFEFRSPDFLIKKNCRLVLLPATVFFMQKDLN